MFTSGPVYPLQPFQKWVDEPIAATERSRVDSRVINVVDG